MDKILEEIVDFITSVSYDQLPAAAIQAAKERLLDTAGCAVGAWDCEAVRIGRSIAAPASEHALSGRILGSQELLAAASATFVNGCMVRDLDFNDTYPGGHPSDGLAAILAVAPVLDASGTELITATVILYEIFIRIQMAAKMREKGWDNGFGIGVGVAGALAYLLGLDRERVRHAVSIVATANIPMRATRAGMLSMWKGAATAFSSQAAVLGTQLAAAGMSGPEAPFTGRHGLADLITGEIALEPFGTAGGEYYIPRAKIKYWPVVYNMQALVWAASQLRDQVAEQELRDVEVQTYWSAWSESGSEAAKWDPQTRETADHSLPYIFAWTLRHGSIGPAAFDPNSFLDPSFRPLMERVTVVIDDDIEALFPRTVKMRLVAHDLEGNEHRVEVVNPLGHEDNPVSFDELTQKFRRLSEAQLGPEGADRAIEVWRFIEKHQVCDALDVLVVPDGARVAASSLRRE